MNLIGIRTNKRSKWSGIVGWNFVMPAALLIIVFRFVPMFNALLLSLQSGKGNNLTFSGFNNFSRLFSDKVFMTSVGNTLLYLVIQVPVMLLLALILASLLNNPKLKCKGFFRTMIFLPCATSLVAYGMVFKQIFTTDGFVNATLLNLNIIDTPIQFLSDPFFAKVIIILALTWRWTGYNMVFYLAGMQSIDSSIYEAARIDGANSLQQFTRITIPNLRPIILMTAILSTTGTLQLFDEVRIMTLGGPGNATIAISNYIYDLSFEYVPQFGYSAAASYIVFLMVAILTFVQMKVGEKT